MAHQKTALVSILMEARLSSTTSRLIERVLEGSPYLALTGDDIAGALLRWRDRELDRIWRELENRKRGDPLNKDIVGKEVIWQA